MKKITRKQELFEEECECGAKITGYTESQVNSRMRMHKLSKEHQERIEKKVGE